MRGQEELLVVFHYLQSVGLDRRVCGVDDRNINLAILERLDRQRSAAVFNRGKARVDVVRLLQALRPIRAVLRFRVRAEGERLGDVLEILAGGEVVLLRELLRHGVSVLVRGAGLVENLQALRGGIGKRGVDILAGALRGVLDPVLEQRAGVLGEDVDVAGLDLGHVDLALTNTELAVDRVASILKRLCVGRSHDLVGVVILRADHDGIRVAGTFQVLRAAAARERDRRGGKQSDKRFLHYFFLPVKTAEISKSTSRMSANAMTTSEPPIISP